MAFWGQTKAGQIAGSWKNHQEIRISWIFFQSSHLVDMKIVVKWWKGFLLYFTTPETYPGLRSFTYSVIHDSIAPRKELCSKMALGEVGMSLP